MIHIPFGLGVVIDGKSKKRKSPTPESKLQKALIEYLKLLPWVSKVNRHNVGMSWMGASQFSKGRPVYFSERGHSDLSIEIKGDPRIVWIETKAPGARPSGAKQRAHWDEQEAFLARKRASGHPAFFCSAGEILRTELLRADLQAPTIAELVEGMRGQGIHPSTIAAFTRRMRLAFFEVPLKSRVA
jgi:hypothetical protein